MKIFKKSIILLFAAITLILCMFTSACGAGNAEVLGMDVYPMGQSFRPGYDLGVAFKYGIKDAEIEMYNYSEDSKIIFDYYEDIKEWDKYKYFSEPAGMYKGKKEITHSDGSLYYTNYPVFQIRPLKSWGFEHKNVWHDYVSFVARKNGKIIGYAVMFFWAESIELDFEVVYGKGKVLADKEVSDISEEAVKEKISKIIDKHKN